MNQQSNPAAETIEDVPESFYPGKKTEAGEASDDQGLAVAEEVLYEDERIELEPQPGFTSARSASTSLPRARPHRSRRLKADSIDLVNLSDVEGDQPRQVSISFLPSDFELIERFRQSVSQEHGHDLTAGEVVRLALRCFEIGEASKGDESDFRTKAATQEVVLTN